MNTMHITSHPAHMEMHDKNDVNNKLGLELDAMPPIVQVSTIALAHFGLLDTVFIKRTTDYGVPSARKGHCACSPPHPPV